MRVRDVSGTALRRCHRSYRRHPGADRRGQVRNDQESAGHPRVIHNWPAALKLIPLSARDGYSGWQLGLKR